MDASVVVKLLWEEEGSELAQQLFERHGPRLAAPALLHYEVANVIRGSRRLPPQRRRALLEEFQRLDLRLIELDGSVMMEALSLAMDRDISVYDASYVILARRLDARLVTADARLVRTLRDPKVVSLSEDRPEDT